MSAGLHPLVQIEIGISLTLRGSLARSVIEQAERLSKEPSELMADVIEAVFEGDIVDAVLDND